MTPEQRMRVYYVTAICLLVLLAFMLSGCKSTYTMNTEQWGESRYTNHNLYLNGEHVHTTSSVGKLDMSRVVNDYKEITKDK